jgi:hypothetical protein
VNLGLVVVEDEVDVEVVSAVEELVLLTLRPKA